MGVSFQYIYKSKEDFQKLVKRYLLTGANMVVVQAQQNRQRKLVNILKHYRNECVSVQEDEAKVENLFDACMEEIEHYYQFVERK